MARVRATVKTVTDGDTFETTRGMVIRLVRVNTPERGKPGWLQAKKDLENLILGKEITYESVARDAFGRVVAEVWVDSLNVNDAMRAKGWKQPD